MAKRKEPKNIVVHPQGGSAVVWRKGDDPPDSIRDVLIVYESGRFGVSFYHEQVGWFWKRSTVSFWTDLPQPPTEEAR